MAPAASPSKAHLGLSPSTLGLFILGAATLTLGACAERAKADEALAYPLPIEAPVTAEEVADIDDSPVAEHVLRSRADLAAIAAIPAGERTFDNTVRAFDDTVARFFNGARMTAFMGEVHPDADVRELGRQADAAIDEFFNTLTKNEEVFLAIQGFSESQTDLDPVDARLLEQILRDFRREGMTLSSEERDQLLEIDRALNEKGNLFRQNISEDKTRLYFSASDLVGVPESFLGSLERMGSMYVVPMNGASIGRILGNCENAETREQVILAYSMRAVPENVVLLEELIALRSKKAHLLGYETIAHYQSEVRMAKTPAAIMDFYADLRPRLRAKALVDFEEFRSAKSEHVGDPEATFNAWDYSFYKNRLLREKYAVDSEAVRAYFPIETVTEGLFAITQQIYGISYEDITARAEELGLPAPWHEDVKLFAVTDEASDKLLGHFYIDLHPRPNKYSHAAQFPLHLRKEWSDGSVTTPLVALVCNFTKPTADAPSLLAHSEVRTFFHEFGHCLHSILTEAGHAWFSGTQVARDFVEAPSQMFEEWIWDADVLQTFARHYETGEVIPRELVDGIVAARTLGSGLSTEGQVFLGMMDMAFHMDPDGEVDTTAVRAEVYAQTRLFEPLANLPSQANFGHLVGYEAGYYGYQWSLVYAADMAGRFRELGLLNPVAGAAYRAAVLSKGGSMEELEMVGEFLGREPNSAAYLRQLGLGK
ncbi:MAG: thimet oligopeptidase [Gammaproteobacteria bacterium]|jgi:thimet oligopeptidase